MKRSVRVLLFILQFATLGLALAFVVIWLLPQRFAAAPINSVANGPASYANAVIAAKPSVVNIYTRKLITETPIRVLTDPRTREFSAITLAPSRQRLERSLGSGVIVRESGVVLTNYHVVAGADDILIGLSDGRVTTAQVVGSDRDTDLAVLRIDGNNFPAISSANRELAVGDVVLAIGNPLGLGQTVTLGIVSATARNQSSLSLYEDFIQTDAAINFGNSGGALVNAEGQLVGINSAIFGQGQGIGFAIPASAAFRVLDQIIEYGYVIRGWMGTEYTDAPPLPGAQNLPIRRGVQIKMVMPQSPADLAGLIPNDILLRFNGNDIIDEGDLRAREAAAAPGSSVKISGLRAGVPFEREIILIQRGGGNAG